MTTRTATIYLSTDSTTNPPIDATDRATTTWEVDWDKVFNGTKGYCKINTRLVSRVKFSSINDSLPRKPLGRFGAKSFECFYRWDLTIKNKELEMGDIMPHPFGANDSYDAYFILGLGQTTSLYVIPSGKLPFTFEILGNWEIDEETKRSVLKPLKDMPHYDLQLTFEWEDDSLKQI